MSSPCPLSPAHALICAHAFTSAPVPHFDACRPAAATMLYDALHTLLQKYKMRLPLMPAQPQQYDAPRSQFSASTAPQLQGVAQPGQQQQQQQHGQRLNPNGEDSSTSAASAGAAHQAPSPPLAVASAASNNSIDVGQNLSGLSQQLNQQSLHEHTEPQQDRGHGVRGMQACAGRRRLMHGCALVHVAKPTGRSAGARHGAACGQRIGLHRPFKKVGALHETAWACPCNSCCAFGLTDIGAHTHLNSFAQAHVF